MKEPNKKLTSNADNARTLKDISNKEKKEDKIGLSTNFEKKRLGVSKRDNPNFEPHIGDVKFEYVQKRTYLSSVVTQEFEIAIPV